MFGLFKRIIELEKNNFALITLTEQLEIRLTEAKERYAQLYEDWNHVTGLNRSKAAAQASKVAPGDAVSPKAGTTDQFQMRSTPSQALAKLQAQLDAAHKKREADGVRAAIEEFEKDLNIAPVGAEVG